MSLVSPINLDADWELFDNVQQVTLRIRECDDQFGDAQTVDAIDLSSPSPETYAMMAAAGDMQFATSDTPMVLRGRQITGKVLPGSEITDWNGKKLYVSQAVYKTHDTRVICACHP